MSARPEIIAGYIEAWQDGVGDGGIQGDAFITYIAELEAENKRLQKLVSAHIEYEVELGKELLDMSGLAYVHGWASTRVESGKACRAKIAVLTEEES